MNPEELFGDELEHSSHFQMFRIDVKNLKGKSYTAKMTIKKRAIPLKKIL